MSQGDELFKAIGEGKIDHVREMLREDSQLIFSRNEQGVSPPLWALYHARQDLAEMLGQMKPRLDIFESAALGQMQALQALVHEVPEFVNSFSSDGFTPLHLACFMGRPGAVKHLIAHGADINALSRNGADLKPLNSASAGRNLEIGFEIARLLLEHGADVGARQRGGYTALHSAAANGNLPLVKLLLEFGADRGICADDGKTPLDFARERNRQAVVEFLS